MSYPRENRGVPPPPVFIPPGYRYDKDIGGIVEIQGTEAVNSNGNGSGKFADVTLATNGRGEPKAEQKLALQPGDIQYGGVVFHGDKFAISLLDSQVPITFPEDNPFPPVNPDDSFSHDHISFSSAASIRKIPQHVQVLIHRELCRIPGLEAAIKDPQQLVKFKLQNYQTGLAELFRQVEAYTVKSIISKSTTESDWAERYSNINIVWSQIESDSCYATAVQADARPYEKVGLNAYDKNSYALVKGRYTFEQSDFPEIRDTISDHLRMFVIRQAEVVISPPSDSSTAITIRGESQLLPGEVFDLKLNFRTRDQLDESIIRRQQREAKKLKVELVAESNVIRASDLRNLKMLLMANSPALRDTLFRGNPAIAASPASLTYIQEQFPQLLEAIPLTQEVLVHERPNFVITEGQQIVIDESFEDPDSYLQKSSQEQFAYMLFLLVSVNEVLELVRNDKYVAQQEEELRKRVSRERTEQIIVGADGTRINRAVITADEGMPVEAHINPFKDNPLLIDPRENIECRSYSLIDKNWVKNVLLKLQPVGKGVYVVSVPGLRLPLYLHLENGESLDSFIFKIRDALTMIGIEPSVPLAAGQGRSVNNKDVLVLWGTRMKKKKTQHEPIFTREIKIHKILEDDYLATTDIHPEYMHTFKEMQERIAIVMEGRFDTAVERLAKVQPKRTPHEFVDQVLVQAVAEVARWIDSVEKDTETPQHEMERLLMIQLGTNGQAFPQHGNYTKLFDEAMAQLKLHSETRIAEFLSDNSFEIFMTASDNRYDTRLVNVLPRAITRTQIRERSTVKVKGITIPIPLVTHETEVDRIQNPQRLLEFLAVCVLKDDAFEIGDHLTPTTVEQIKKYGAHVDNLLLATEGQRLRSIAQARLKETTEFLGQVVTVAKQEDVEVMQLILLNLYRDSTKAVANSLSVSDYKQFLTQLELLSEDQAKQLSAVAKRVQEYVLSRQYEIDQLRGVDKRDKTAIAKKLLYVESKRKAVSENPFIACLCEGTILPQYEPAQKIAQDLRREQVVEPVNLDDILTTLPTLDELQAMFANFQLAQTLPVTQVSGLSAGGAQAGVDHDKRQALGAVIASASRIKATRNARITAEQVKVKMLIRDRLWNPFLEFLTQELELPAEMATQLENNETLMLQVANVALDFIHEGLTSTGDSLADLYNETASTLKDVYGKDPYIGWTYVRPQKPQPQAPIATEEKERRRLAQELLDKKIVA